jgi:hypothetical protein
MASLSEKDTFSAFIFRAKSRTFLRDVDIYLRVYTVQKPSHHHYHRRKKLASHKYNKSFPVSEYEKNLRKVT